MTHLRNTDVRVVAVQLYFLPVNTRVPLKFGHETLTSVTCARARITVIDQLGNTAQGWGETPLSVQWVWPGKLPYQPRHHALKQFCIELARAWASFDATGHAMEVGHDFQQQMLPHLTRTFNARLAIGDDMPYLAALLCCSPFDIALHDAYANAAAKPVYQTYTPEFMTRDLASFLTGETAFAQKWPNDFLVHPPPTKLPAWHLVGGLDPLEPTDLIGDEPDDGYPVLLPLWIRTDGLKCLKVKLRGNDPDWDYDRLLRVGNIAIQQQADWLSTDFNCTVSNVQYVNNILDRLRDHHPRIYAMILYVEQPFPYDLQAHRIDVHSVSARKPLFMDESAHDWHSVKLGRSLGWTGVALKTCKTQTGALLSLCYAKANGMTLMVQDLTNPMLAQIPHVLLAAHAGTIMGVETNAMQFYPDASALHARVHPGLYHRAGGCVDLSTIGPTGFGYRIDEIAQPLPSPAFTSTGPHQAT
ncbi:MAG: hypothetical protein NTU53_07295 [Planctomycetota bacterium]|nr:hypothetical protein [Planctomycetota bacterium]